MLMSKGSPQAFEESRVITRKKLSFRNPVMVVGLPGIGLVSKLAADNIARTAGAEHYAVLYSKHFPNQVLALSSGKLRLFGIHFYKAKVGKIDVVVVKGDLQPLTVEGQYEVAGRILDHLKQIGGSTVISMAGYAINRIAEKPRVFAASTSKGLFKKLSTAGVAAPAGVVPIVGMAGVMPGLARIYGLKGACLLVETPGPIVDGKGATALSDVLSKFLGGKINTTKLGRRASKAARLIQKFEQQANIELPQASAKPPEISYIR
ncbi:MAG: PAC2 family protein [Candidatus Micrarchaeota archaeon]